MKLVGVMAVRNEQWVLGLSLRAALLALDELVVLDHASADGTPALIERVAREHPGRVHVLREDDPVWREASIRQLLLEAARGLGATHVCPLDADEVISGNLLPGLRDALAPLAPGEALWLPWLDLWRGLDRYRGDRGFSNYRMVLGFRDAPAVGYAPSQGGYDIHARRPLGLAGERCFPASREEGGVLHLAFAHWRRIQTRTAWYKMTEVLRFPWRRGPELLNRNYDHHLDESGLQTVPVDPEWWAPYAPWRGEVDLGESPWFEDECRRLLAEHGPEAFRGLDLWGVAEALPWAV
ncbi:MAG TPA: glycosyltransferase [Thermoanaerobaculia bacterium]|nr:glycosyltransferase [Thermoanaerobaculia bacterium]